MLKTFAFRSALVLTLTVLAAPASRIMHAQSIDAPVTPDAVTGGDPQPTGEPPKGNGTSAVDPATLAILMALGLS